jgi:hypothetical protein
MRAARSEFVNWIGAVNSEDETVAIELNGDKSEAANFAEIPPPPGNPPSDCSADWVSGCSPIVVNLDEGGYRLTGADSPVYFDIAATGIPIRIGWTAAAANEAFLALDRDHDGKITSGAELFGTATPLASGQRAGNGFIALAEFDQNHDGVIEERDPIWPELLLWRDWNHDGISPAEELIPVAHSVITAIGLDYHWAARRDHSGNKFRYKSEVWLKAHCSAKPRPFYDDFFVPIP